jgi:clan AA aspartic protease (TIGR02281 family)
MSGENVAPQIAHLKGEREAVRRAMTQNCSGPATSGAAIGDQLVGRINQRPAGGTAVPLKQRGGTFVVPVTINGTIQLAFTIDSGAADVSIPADVVITLIRAGTISNADFLGKRLYRLADGSTTPSQAFRIRSLAVGDRVLENVTGSIAPASASLLLGQSFLSRFQSWSIDNQRMVLVLE